MVKDSKGELKLIWDSVATPNAVKNLEKIELAKTDKDLLDEEIKMSKKSLERFLGKNYKIRRVEGVKDEFGLPKMVIDNDELPAAVKNLETIKNNTDGKRSKT